MVVLLILILASVNASIIGSVSITFFVYFFVNFVSVNYSLDLFLPVFHLNNNCTYNLLIIFPFYQYGMDRIEIEFIPKYIQFVF